MRDSPLSVLVLLALALAPARLSPQEAVPRFERSSCDYPVPAGIPAGITRECGHLVVLANRARPNGQTYRLAVVTYKAREPGGSLPLLLLHGGPGGAGGTRFPWSELRSLPFTRHRDVITFDMRGVSASEPTICPRFVEDARPAFRRATRQEWEAGHRESVRTCVDSLDARGIDRSTFGADINAADAIDLRRVLGYTKWDIYGVSYGGIVVQELLRLDSAALNAAAIVSSPPHGDDWAAENALNYQRMLERVFASCAAQPECNSAFPALEQDFYALFDEFSARPVDVSVADVSPPPVLLNGERFLLELRREFGTPQTLRRLPLLINELRRGDRAAALQRLLGGRALQPWDALGRIVQCNEYGAGYRAAVARVLPQLRAPFRTVADDFREHCDLWLPSPTRQADSTRVASDVPTLILDGEFDINIPAAQERIAAKLTRAYTYMLPGETHAEPPFGCHGAIVQQFFQNPQRAPDASCIGLMPGIIFRTSGFEPTLTIVIKDTAGARTPFAGTWEATLGGGPDWLMQLETAGSTVRGMIMDYQLPIFDGTIADGALRFRVRSPDEARIITFTATMQGNELQLTRAVDVLVDIGPPTPGLLNILGLNSATARRVRPRIERAQDLPRHTYRVTTTALNLVQDSAQFAALARQLEADLRADLAAYDIQDRATVRMYYSTLVALAMHRHDHDAALALSDSVRALEDRPAFRPLVGLELQPTIDARRAPPERRVEVFHASFRRALAALQHDQVRPTLRAVLASMESMTPNMLLGSLAALEPVVSTGEISREIAQQIVFARGALERAQYRDAVIETLSEVIAAYTVAKPDIWAARAVSLEGRRDLTPVVIAIWDSGTDVTLFQGRLFTNEKEIAGNGRDDDGNGFIDDVHGIGYDARHRKMTKLLVPLSHDAQQEARFRGFSQGYGDMKAGISSPEAAELRRVISSLRPEEARAFNEGLAEYDDYVHGTHVAGIAVAGNPAARILTICFEVDGYKPVPTLPTLELVQAEARKFREISAYLRTSGARIANLSFGYGVEDFESALERNHAGGSADDRRALAQRMFDVFAGALREAIASAPDVLFLTAAGNTNTNNQFTALVPASFDLPNLLTVGAVDQSGDEATFTSYGKVDLYANGVGVPSVVPGGAVLRASGTSMAAPQVANLAAKLLAMKPDLTVTQLKDLILRGTEEKSITPEKRIRLLNPQRSMQLLLER